LERESSTVVDTQVTALLHGAAHPDGRTAAGLHRAQLARHPGDEENSQRNIYTLRLGLHIGLELSVFGWCTCCLLSASVPSSFPRAALSKQLKNHRSRSGAVDHGKRASKGEPIRSGW
jgi:hypothetical protein